MVTRGWGGESGGCGAKGAKFQLRRMSKFWRSNGQRGDHSYHILYSVLEICYKRVDLVVLTAPQMVNLIVVNLSQWMRI